MKKLLIILICLWFPPVALGTTAVLNAFNSGELSPLLEGRTDVRKYYFLVDKPPVILYNTKNIEFIGDSKMCKEEDCKEQEIHAKGYCKYHYHKQYNAQLSPERKQRAREGALRTYHKHKVKYRARQKTYYQSQHGKAIRARVARNYRQRLKLEILTHYSEKEPQCISCGFKDMRALCLDHTNDDGAAHRKKVFGGARKGSSTAMYEWLKHNGFPKEFQVLCANCNLIKEFERKRPKYEK